MSVAYLGKHDLSEKGRVALIALFTLGAMALTSFAISHLGLWQVWRWIHAQPIDVGLIVTMALWGSVMLLLTRGVRIATIVIRLCLLAVPAAGRAFLYLTRLLGRGVARFLHALAAWALGPAFPPLELRVLLIRDGIGNALAPLIHRAREEFWLRRVWRDEFRERFPRFQDFRREFENAGRDDAKGRRGQPAKRDPFKAACEVMGLPADGMFSEDEFRSRYRALMKALHPDRGGPADRAALVNAASMAIKQGKGWS
jgi:hypothetical protein